MALNAHDTNDVPRFLLVDSSGKLILADTAALIGHVKISDGTETANVTTDNQLETFQSLRLSGKTMIHKNASASNQTTTIHTVTTGKTFYLVQAGLFYSSTANDATAILEINTGANMLLYMRSKITTTYWTTDTDSQVATYPLPIPIAAGKTIDVQSDNAVLGTRGWIIGWEE